MVDLEDLISYGQVGLAKAASEYDPNRGVKFATYAHYRIRGAIYDGIYTLSWRTRSELRRIRFQKAADEVMESEMSDDQVPCLGAAVSRFFIIGLAVDAGDTGPRADQIADSALTGSDAVAKQETLDLVRRGVERLSDDERELIRLTFFENRTLTEAAETLGKSKAWASRLRTRAIDNLAKHLRGIGITECA